MPETLPFQGDVYSNIPQGTTGDNSSIGPQIHDSHFIRKSIIASREESFFGQFASTIKMPMHQGKVIEWMENIPMLDERNNNSMGIDAAGVKLEPIAGSEDYVDVNGQRPYDPFTGQPIDHATALNTVFKQAVTNDPNGDDRMTGYGEDPSTYPGQADGTAGPGNLIGGLRDMQTIANAFPSLKEGGGRFNKVSLKRFARKSSMYRFGFFHDYSRESIMFDTNPNILQEKVNEMLYGANRLCEYYLQRDITNAGSTILYPGFATSRSSVESEISYQGLGNLSVMLDRNLTPKGIKAITGSTMFDTKTVEGGRALLVGPEVVSMMRNMVDGFGRPALTLYHEYAASGMPKMKGEIGKIDRFTVIEVNDMLSYKGVGKAASDLDQLRYATTDGRFDVFPMICVGTDSFTNIGFSDSIRGGKTYSKFNVMHRKPGVISELDPYADRGIISLQWWMGTMVQRPERIGVAYTIAPRI